MQSLKRFFAKIPANVKRNVLIAAAIIIIVISAILFINRWERLHSDFEGSSDDSLLYVQYNGRYYERRMDVDAVLIAGLDKFDTAIENDSYNNDRQADFLLLLIIDHGNKTCSAVHINRDTMAEINVLGIGGNKVGTITGQLALSHSFGKGGTDSGRNTARAVSGLLGIHIDNYATLTMDAVATLNDLVGGVTLTVKDDLTSVDSTLKKGETVTLRGENALNYVRARSGLDDSSNVARMERQRQYLTELYKMVLEALGKDEGFSEDALAQMSDYLTSDFSVNAVDELFDALGEYEFGEIYTLDGELKTGEQYMEFYLDKDSTTALMVSLLYKEKN